ncbi:MAG: sugar phosphate isomerase/epimerase family protein [Bacteroidota bacterium]
MNLLLWTTQMEEKMLPVLEKIKAMGFDGVEVPIFDVNPAKWQAWSKRLDDIGLERIAVTFCGAEFNAISPEISTRQQALERNQLAVECTQALGATLLTGPYHSALGVFTGKGATEQEWAWSIEHTQKMAEKAKNSGVMLGIEYLNRFENYLLTSAADTVRYVQDVNHPSCQMMYDTFHANIEEKDLAASITSSAKRLVHVQISENDRSTPGKGHINWKAIFDALTAIQYDGWLSIEAFGLTPPDLASAAHIYRRMFTSEDQLASEGLAFLKSEIKNRTTIACP